MCLRIQEFELHRRQKSNIDLAGSLEKIAQTQAGNAINCKKHWAVAKTEFVHLKREHLQIRSQTERLLGQLHHFFGAAPVLGDAFRAVPVVVDDREATAFYISPAPLQLNSGSAYSARSDANA